MDEFIRDLEKKFLSGDLAVWTKLRRALKRVKEEPSVEILGKLIKSKQADAKNDDEIAKKWLRHLRSFARSPRVLRFVLDPLLGNPEKWRQISGDVGAIDYRAVLGRIDPRNELVELWRVDNVVDSIGEGDAREVGAPFWVDEASFSFDELNFSENEARNNQILSALSSCSMTRENWEDFDYYTRAEIMSSHSGYDGNLHGAERNSVLPVPAEEIDWWAPHTTEDWDNAAADFDHSIMYDCFDCPRCGARTSIDRIEDYKEPIMIDLRKWPQGETRPVTIRRKGNCGCNLDLQWFFDNEPEITCKLCLNELEQYDGDDESDDQNQEEFKEGDSDDADEGSEPKYRRNVDEDLRRAERDDPERYLHILKRVSSTEYFREIRRLHGDEAAVDALIQDGKLDAARKADAIKYLQGLQFAWLSQPTAKDILSEGHQALCHADRYPGHCCLRHLTKKFRDGEYHVFCRHCEDTVATEDKNEDVYWTDPRKLTCAIPGDPLDSDY